MVGILYVVVAGFILNDSLFKIGIFYLTLAILYYHRGTVDRASRV